MRTRFVKSKILSTVLAAFTATATAASAGTIVVPVADPVIAPAPALPSWQGFYAGATLGWATGEATFPTSPPLAIDSFTYGGFAGYNHILDSGFVIGGEIAATVLSLNDRFGGAVNTVFDAKLRAGVEAGRALIYASGGYSRSWDNAGNVGSGWNVGAGVDYLVTDSLFVGAEYVYRDITDTATPSNWRDRFHTVQMRAGIKF